MNYDSAPQVLNITKAISKSGGFSMWRMTFPFSLLTRIKLKPYTYPTSDQQGANLDQAFFVRH
jgi:hypothetical protein